MRWSYRIGRIAGIPVQVHVTFLLLMGWIALQRGGIAAVAMLLLIFACVVLHELGHALAARRYGIATRDITLLPIGGVARLERMPDKPTQELVVAVAGPAVNVVIAGALALIPHGLDRPSVDAVTKGSIVESLFVTNVLMILFNMIPAFPMDGGRVLRALLAMRLSYERATRIASGIGQIVALLFGVAGVFGVPGFHPPDLLLVFIALFVFLAAGEERTVVQTRVSIKGLPVRAAMLTEFHQLDVHDPLSLAVRHLMAGSQQDFPVTDAGVPVGVLSRDQLVSAIARHGPSAPVEQAVRRDPLRADPNAPLDQALSGMRDAGRMALPVTEGGRLVGLLTLDNVGDLLLVRQALRRHIGDAQA